MKKFCYASLKKNKKMKPSNSTYTSLYHKLAEQLEENHSAIAMVTLIEKKGSCPQQTGAKMLIAQEQKKPLLGTIGGGSLEAYAINFVTQQFRDTLKVRILYHKSSN